jgi:hypothetical protein
MRLVRLRPVRPIVASCVVVVSALLSGCGSSATTTGTTTLAPSTTASAPPAKKRAGSRASAQSAGVTGFGATDAAWNSAHTPDSQFASGEVYKADPSLPSINGNVGAAYTQLLHQDGHVLGYDYGFHSVPISQARALVLRTEFSGDAKVLWFVTKGSCAQMMVQSKTLGEALGSHAIGDAAGTAQVEFGSGAGTTYDAGSVDDALMQLLPNSGPGGAPGC